MAEPRRVELKTISTNNVEKKDKKRPQSQRFTLALGESTASTCPEYSFTELLKKEKGTGQGRVTRRSLAADGTDSRPRALAYRVVCALRYSGALFSVRTAPRVLENTAGPGPAQGIDPDDPFGEEDDHDEVAAIARKFEEKYGPKPKKKLKCLEDEYYDLGEGYDENDPFIDNTEAYDEVVPSCLTTQHGGFYINRGTLDFRTLSDQDDSAAEFTPVGVKKRGRPRKILDSESEQDEGGEPKKRKIKVDGEKIIKRRKPLDPDRKKKTSPTVAELLKQQTASTSATPNGTLDDFRPATPSLTPDLHPVDKSTIQDRIDAVVFEQLQDGPSEDRKTNGGESGVPNNLPSDLPAELARNIYSIKQAAKDTTEGKCKFFSGNVNKMLLDIELGSRQLALGKRSSIYAHLADHLPCGKETLIKRAKKLRENQQDDQLKGPIQRLKDAINEVMPALQEQHDQEVLRYRMENKEKTEDAGDGTKEEGANTESDEEEKTSTAGATDGQSRKGNRGPRKKFKWTPDIKKLLCQIVSVKMQMFDTYRNRNQTAEEYLKTFLDNEVKPLWPQGWIQTRMLFKESRSVHGSWTNPLKPKKPILVTKSAASPQPQVPASVSPENLPDNRQAKTSVVTDVIELSNDDDDQPLALAPKKDTKVNTAPTVLDVADEPRLPPAVDMLNISPNSVAKIAAAAAAAVSTPKTQPQPAVGDRHQRETLVTEILKGMKPNALVSSSTGKADSAGDGKSKPSPQIQWQMDSLLNEDKSFLQRKTSPGSPAAGIASGSQPPSVHVASDGVSAQQANYKKMYSLLSEPTTAAQRSKGDMVRDEILSRIQAEMDMASLKGGASRTPVDDHSRKSSASQPSSKQHPQGHSPSGRQSSSVTAAATHTGTNQRHSMGGVIPPAHQLPSQLYPQAAGGSLRQTATSGSPLSLVSPSGDRGSNGSKPSSASAYSPQQQQQHSPVQSSPPAARSGLTVGRHSGRDSPHKKLTSKSSPTSGHHPTAFQRNIPGQAASKPPQTHGGKVSGQSSPSQRSSAFTRHSSHSQGQRSPAALGQMPHTQRSPHSGHASSHSLDGTRKLSTSPSAPQKLHGSGSNSVSPGGGGGAQRGMEHTLYEQIENQMKQQAAMEQKALQNLALGGLLPPGRQLKVPTWILKLQRGPQSNWEQNIDSHPQQWFPKPRSNQDMNRRPKRSFDYLSLNRFISLR
ncbi:hypothetical protein BaRGS_00022804 [Batillaria attramentaria]|uniref:Ubinuclein middle domain-containing protein n=1 Tax=Batillaria attramentaria TaxID=370345 RepID=A0ABD0KFK9_9CAEN